MYNIGICDDGKVFCGFMESMILNYIKENGILADIKVWFSGEGLCKSLKMGDRPDILFLDIELLELNGMQVAHFIRNELEDRGMQIVFVSAKKSYAQDLFRTQPMDFLIKPIDQVKINETLNLAIKILSKEGAKFTFRNGREHYAIPFGEIMYFASEGREIKLVTQCGEKRFYGKLKDLIDKLPLNFIVIHQSYIVNKKYIMQYGYETVTLSNGCTLAISKNKRKEVREKIMREEWL